MAWRRKVHLLTKEDQGLSARLEQQELEARPKSHADVVEMMNREAEMQEIYKKNGWVSRTSLSVFTPELEREVCKSLHYILVSSGNRCRAELAPKSLGFSRFFRYSRDPSADCRWYP